MTKKFICNGEKYEAGGAQEETIGLAIYPSGLPATIDVKGYTLFLKDVFHISLVCIGKIIEKHGVDRPDFINEVKADFCDFVQNTEIRLLRYTGEFRFVTSDEKRSVIAMCDIEGLAEFFDLLNNKYGLNIEYPPTHATLYTLQPNAGIFVTDQAGVDALTERVEVPEVKIF